MYKVMIIEDNDSVRRELSVFLQQNGFETITPSVVTQIDEAIRSSNPDVILLDINLMEEDELKGLLLGGDDFIRKPYYLPVLLARIRRILERYEKAHGWHAGDVYLDVVAMNLRTKNHTMELSKNEYRILYHLFINKGRTVTKDELRRFCS
ncbi:MAG: response regulator transcription factor [Lachnospiraceae bacterium]